VTGSQIIVRPTVSCGNNNVIKCHATRFEGHSFRSVVCGEDRGTVVKTVRHDLAVPEIFRSG
jgi:hypothetical protein